MNDNSAPKAEKRLVLLILKGTLNKYEILGVANVESKDFVKKIEEAKGIARSRGGDAIMPVVMTNGIVDLQKINDNDKKYQLKSFIILQTKSKVSQNAKDEDEEKEKDSASSYPSVILSRTTIGKLVDDIEIMAGKNYRGSVYPIGFLNYVPEDLSAYTRKDKKLLMTKTQSGKYNLYLLVPMKRADRFEKIIQSKEILNFVYTPVSIIKSKYPVLEFIEEIGGE